jgi:hypothetical protein
MKELVIGILISTLYGKETFIVNVTINFSEYIIGLYE